MIMRVRTLPLAVSVLLSACTGIPPKTPPVLAAPPPAAVVITPTPPPPADEPETSPTTDVWDRLRDSFAMADCDADPAVMRWASRYTRHPKQFESQLQAVLPRLVYVQQIASQYDVAGEFVLLPWVESHFQPVAARKGRPAGMWQIMPVTAGAMGLRVDGHYDGRLDLPAAAHAVMRLMRQYHEQFHDWRVADYAYNAGEFTVRKMIRKHGMPAEQPTVPDWPVRKVTRNHLVKLLAIACVVREPERFNVSLPTLPDERHLVKTTVHHSMPLARAADHAGMSVDALKHFNAAFRNGMVDADAASYLLMPAKHALQFQDALAGQSHGVQRLAANASAVTTAPRKTYTVKAGDSLWSIARRHSLSVNKLQQWNAMRGHTIKPGLVLNLSAPD